MRSIPAARVVMGDASIKLLFKTTDIRIVGRLLTRGAGEATTDE